jgi:hypothetical protein
MRHNRFGIIVGSLFVVSGAFCAVGCSGSAGSPLSGSRAENTGTIVAELDTIPSDVRCLNITAYGPAYGNNAFADVTPGGKATVRVGSLDPGEYFLSGNAYNASCSAVQSADGSTPQQTWIAQSTSTFVSAGGNAHVTLHFFPLGSLTIGASFDSCADAGNTTFCAQDAGSDVILSE